MGRLAVVAERLAMVGEIDDQRVAAHASASSASSSRATCASAYITSPAYGVGAFRAVLRGRLVRPVRIVQVHPEVERALAARGCRSHASAASTTGRRAVDIGESPALEPRIVEQIVVRLVPLADAPARMEHVGRHEARGRVAAARKRSASVVASFPTRNRRCRAPRGAEGRGP